MNTELLLKELSFKAVRSSGAGGQHVNKVASKVEVHFNLATSQVFSEEEKSRLTEKLRPRLTSENVLVLQCDETRSQHRNKAIVIARLISLLEEGLREEKVRKPTKPGRAATEKRLKSKREQSRKKANRKPPEVD